MVFNINRILKTLNRKKLVDEEFESPLRRCLVFADLLLLGIGGSVDVALYVVLGNVIRDIAGPAVLISMLFGFIVCLGAALCYAEFASFIPSSGSDYDYIYTSLGEICGFYDGWSGLVFSVIATAALAQGAADLLNSLTDSVTFDNIDANVGLTEHTLLAPNMNVVALLIVTLVTVITALGVHGSIRFNDCIVVINLLVVAFTVILGLFHLNFDYWSSWEKFAPYGVSGILKALPFTVFFYGGFVCVTFSTEEVINPSTVLPRSIMSSIFGIFVAFLLVGTVQCLVIPYNKLPLTSPLSDAFGIVSFKASKYIIAVGGFCSCFSSVLTASYANSRLSYVMSRDGLLAYYLSKVNSHTMVPIYAVITSGILAGMLAAFAHLTILVELCSILALLPYLLLLYAVITIRYKENLFMTDIERGSNGKLQVNAVTTDSEIHNSIELQNHVFTGNGLLVDVPGWDDNLPNHEASTDSAQPETTASEDSSTELPSEVLTGNDLLVDVPGSDAQLPIHNVVTETLLVDGQLPIHDATTDSVQPKTTASISKGSTTELQNHVFTENNFLVNVPGWDDQLTIQNATKDSDKPGSNEELRLDTVTNDSAVPKAMELPCKVFAEGTVKIKIKVSLAVLVVSSASLALSVRFGISYNIDTILFGVLLAVFTIPLVTSVLVIWYTPYTEIKFPFTMPLFPILPLLCMAMTLFVMLQFSLWAWILFGGNTIFGLILYLCYGKNHSVVQKRYAKPTTDTTMNTQL